MVFGKKHSTGNQFLLCFVNLYHALDDNSSPITIFFDITETFDTINFDIVLQKLAPFGLDKKCSYLVNRQQRVKIADSYSTISKISTGGPQGSMFAVFFPLCT